MLLLYQFYLTKICVCHKPCPTRDETHDLQIVLPTTLMLLFFYTSSTLQARHIRIIFKLWGRSFCLSLLVSFYVAMKGIQFTQLRCHISFFSFIQFTTCFLSSWGWLLDSRRHRLFYLHIQNATHCLFEQWTSVDSSEAEVCLSISLLPWSHDHTDDNLGRVSCI